MTNVTHETSTAIGSTSPRVVREQQGNALLLDVRTPAEFEEIHIEGAVLHPLNDLNPAHVKRLAEGKGACFVICRSYFVNPGWVALPAFVGAGLMFAGITDTCGMGMVLARMPWNNRKPSSSKASCCSM